MCVCVCVWKVMQEISYGIHYDISCATFHTHTHTSKMPDFRVYLDQIQHADTGGRPAPCGRAGQIPRTYSRWKSSWWYYPLVARIVGVIEDCATESWRPVLAHHTRLAAWNKMCSLGQLLNSGLCVFAFWWKILKKKKEKDLGLYPWNLSSVYVLLRICILSMPLTEASLLLAYF